MVRIIATGMDIAHMAAGVSRDTICASCLHRLAAQSSHRSASTAVAFAQEERTPDSTTSSNPPVTARGPRKAFRLLCSPVLSRPPLLTRELTPFEEAYFLYQKRLNERLALPFTRYFYYKKGTPGDEEWKRKRRTRIAAGRDVGVYNAYGNEGWNDEVLVNSKLGKPSYIVDNLIRDAEGKEILDAQQQNGGKGEMKDENVDTGAATRKPSGDITVERPMPRRSEADDQNDQRSLSRKMDRSLYLLVRRKDGQWRFPEDRVHGKETLHQVSQVDAALHGQED